MTGKTIAIEPVTQLRLLEVNKVRLGPMRAAIPHPNCRSAADVTARVVDTAGGLEHLPLQILAVW